MIRLALLFSLFSTSLEVLGDKPGLPGLGVSVEALGTELRHEPQRIPRLVGLASVWRFSSGISLALGA